MRTRKILVIVTAAALAATSASALAQGRHGGGGAKQMDRAPVQRAQKDFDRDRLRTRDPAAVATKDRDRIRKKDQVHKPDNAGQGNNGIYGSQLMSVEERNTFREQLKLTENDPEARTRLMAEHREKMQQRAKAKGVGIDEAPQGSGNE